MRVDGTGGEKASAPLSDVGSPLRQLNWDKSCMQIKKICISLVRDGAGQRWEPACVPDCSYEGPQVEC